jgi:PQQ-dependent dehydrogenase (methanol/ethanol family)
MRYTLLPLLLASSLLAQVKRVDDAALRTANKTGEEWLTYGSNPQETRYSPLNQINATNVSRLGLAWTYDVGTGGGGQEGTPLVWNGTLYNITNWSIVYAVDARTGKEKWRWDPEVNRDAVRPKLCCGVVSRGIALYDGKIIAPSLDGRLWGLDAETGKPVWESRIAYSQDNYTVTMAPRIAKGKVIIGVAGAEYPVRGFFAAFDAATGKPAWKFYTVPGDPSKGFENAAMKKAAETWDGEWWKMGGGGTVWDGIAYDPETNLVFVGTGNGGPWPESVRGSKGKDNLYVCSVVAVNADTGEYKWHFQMVPGDSWDFDSVQQLMLVDLNIKGRMRKTIMQANKNGFYYVLDRTTGQFISGQPFTQITWAKGLNEATGRPIVNPEAHYTEENSVNISPGPGGAHNWAPMSFNPATGFVYIPSTVSGGFNYTIQPNFQFNPTRQNMGIVFGPPGGGAGAAGGGRAGATAGGNVSPDVANAAAAAPPPPPAPPKPALPKITPPATGPAAPEGQRGALIAWDPVTQTEKWRAPAGGSIGGGTVTTAGNLVIHVTPDGHLFAYSADKGEKLLDIPTGFRGMAPPVTYMLDGKQYISFAGGMGTVVGPGGPGAGGAGPTNAMPKLFTFVLDGKMAMPPSTPPATPAR